MGRGGENKDKNVSNSKCKHLFLSFPFWFLFVNSPVYCGFCFDMMNITSRQSPLVTQLLITLFLYCWFGVNKINKTSLNLGRIFLCQRLTRDTRKENTVTTGHCELDERVKFMQNYWCDFATLWPCSLSSFDLSRKRSYLISKWGLKVPHIPVSLSVAWILRWCREYLLSLFLA